MTFLQKMTSGFGQFHTNEPDPKNPKKILTPYTGIDLSGIGALVDNPKSVDKAQAQWLIPSAFQSRNFKEQEKSGSYYALAADIDSNKSGSLDVIDFIVRSAIGGCDYEIYTTSSATKENAKCRVIVPIETPLDYHEWSICQKLLNDSFHDAGIEPDRATERAAQLLYLPNRGKFYDTRTSRNDNPFNPLRKWAKQIHEYEQALIAKAQQIEADKKAAAERKAARQSFGSISLVDAFNEQYAVSDILIQAGYDQKGSAFRHPHSETGNYSASVRNNRVHTLSSSDPLYTAGNGAHDAFSAFTVLFHSGNEKAARKDGGDNWLAIGDVSFNEFQRREYRKANPKKKPEPAESKPKAIAEKATFNDEREVVEPGPFDERVTVPVDLTGDIMLESIKAKHDETIAANASITDKTTPFFTCEEIQFMATECADNSKCWIETLDGIARKWGRISAIKDAAKGIKADRKAADRSAKKEALSMSFTAFPDVQNRPCFINYEGLEGIENGLYYHYVKHKDGFDVPFDALVSSPLYIAGLVRESSNKNHSLLVKFQSVTGGENSKLISRGMVKGNGNDLIAILQADGASVYEWDLLKKYILSECPENIIESTPDQGWHDHRNFVIPSRNIGKRDDLIFYNGDDNCDKYRQKGTVEEWKDNVGRLCTDNPVMTFQTCVAFSGPLLYKVDMDCVGFNIIGESSSGKSSGHKVSISVFGDSSYGHTWKSTGTGLETAAAGHNDSLLALDELTDAPAKVVDTSLYSLGNGMGKLRGTISITARKTLEWRIALLSNGERSLETHLSEAGISVKAGQLSRFIEIPSARKYGAFDCLHGFEGGAALSNAVKTAVIDYHGAVGMAYIERLAHDERDFRTGLAEMVKKLEPEGISLVGQEERCIRAFAVVALAGELATEYGLTGWKKGDCIESAKICIDAWMTHKGTGATENTAILNKISGYLNKYGDLRFTEWASDEKPHGERSGWHYKDENGAKLWVFTRDGIETATKGHEFDRVIDVLFKADWLIHDKERKTKQLRLSTTKDRPRYHVIKVPEDHVIKVPEEPEENTPPLNNDELGM